MPNYYYANRGNDNQKAKSMQDNEINPGYSFIDKSNERVEKSSRDLVIEGNSVYEIDSDCYEKVRQNRLNARQDWNRR